MAAEWRSWSSQAAVRPREWQSVSSASSTLRRAAASTVLGLSLADVDAREELDLAEGRSAGDSEDRPAVSQANKTPNKTPNLLHPRSHCIRPGATVLYCDAAWSAAEHTTTKLHVSILTSTHSRGAVRFVGPRARTFGRRVRLQFLAVNWLAVLVTAIVNMVFGFLWYGPLFSRLSCAWLGSARRRLSRRRSCTCSDS